MVSHSSSRITPAMREASFLPSVPTQPWTLYEAMRRQLSGSWSESACQLARLSACLLIDGVDAAAHTHEPALHRDDAAAEESHGDDHQPPVDRSGAGERRLDGFAEQGGRGRAGQEPDRGAHHHVPEPHVDRTGDDAFHCEG